MEPDFHDRWVTRNWWLRGAVPGTLLAIGALVGINGCGGPPAGDAPDADSLGIGTDEAGSPGVVVHDMAEAQAIDALPLFGVTEDLRLGSLDDPDYGFSLIGGVDVDGSGNIYVYERFDQTIRVYAPDGHHLRTFGGAGEGPGELSRNGWFGVTGSTVWMVDIPRLRRITLFDLSGAVLSTGKIEGVEVALQDQGRIGYVIPRFLRDDGLFMGRMNQFGVRRETVPNGIGPQDTVRVPRVRFDPSGTVVDTLGWDSYPPPVERLGKEIQVGSTRYRVPQPPSDEPMLESLAGGQWVIDRPLAVSGEVSSFRIRRSSDTGDTIFSREYRYTPRPYPAVVLDSLAFGSPPIPAVFSPDSPRPPLEGAQLRAVQQAIRDAMEFPDFQPPILGAVGGNDGTLWLRLGDLGGASWRWLIIKPDGLAQGVLDLPRDSYVRWANGERFILWEKDEFDVPWLVCFHIEP